MQLKKISFLFLCTLFVLPLVAHADNVARRTMSSPKAQISKPLTVTLTVAPKKGAVAYAVEEIPPHGWKIMSADNGGAILDGVIKWGVFFDGSPRRLTYVIEPTTQAGTASFSGKVSVDGNSFEIGGVSKMPFSRSPGHSSSPSK